MELDKCINEIPHNRISIVPESPQLAFIFDLEDPLPLDWIMKFGKEDNYLYLRSFNINHVIGKIA